MAALLSAYAASLHCAKAPRSAAAHPTAACVLARLRLSQIDRIGHMDQHANQWYDYRYSLPVTFMLQVSSCQAVASTRSGSQERISIMRNQ
jgi:hypothetical protein